MKATVCGNKGQTAWLKSLGDTARALKGGGGGANSYPPITGGKQLALRFCPPQPLLPRCDAP